VQKGLYTLLRSRGKQPDFFGPVISIVFDIPEKEKGMRSEIYQILSECYKEPCIEFAQDVAQGHLYQELSGHLAQWGISISMEGLKIQGEPAEVLQKLKEQYYPLFVGPFPPYALPVESVYKEWAREDQTPLIAPGVRGMLMGDSAIDMLRRYQTSGIEIPAQFKDMPDHLALLLEYMVLLCEAGTDEEQRRFVQDHLGWIPELRKLIYECSESRFYRTVADATAAFVAYEQQPLSSGESHDPSDQVTSHP
jgi:TorA maturation chaperone TorD